MNISKGWKGRGKRFKKKTQKTPLRNTQRGPTCVQEGALGMLWFGKRSHEELNVEQENNTYAVFCLVEIGKEG